VATVQYSGRVPIDAAYSVGVAITCEMPNSKSWVKTTVTVDDTAKRVKTLTFESPLTFGDKPWTWDLNTPNATYGVFRNPADTAVLTQIVGARGGNAWTVQTGAQGELRAYESSTPARGATAAGWGHLLDATRAAAFGVDKFAAQPGTYTISLSGQGHAAFGFSPAQPSAQHTLTVYQHFVTTPVAIGAATSPTAMLHPLTVVVRNP
jgi:predicted secreted protein